MFIFAAFVPEILIIKMTSLVNCELGYGMPNLPFQQLHNTTL